MNAFYAAPESPAELEFLLAEHGSTVTLLAGGMSLLPLLNQGIGQRDRIIVLGRVAGLDRIERDGEDLVVGATATHTTLAVHPEIRRHCPVLGIAAAGIGDPQVRNRGTVGGALAHANPGADEITALAALDAQVELTGVGGRRCVPVAEFVRGAQHTARRPHEYVSAVRVPLSGPGGYHRLCRVQGAPPTVTAAVVAPGNGHLGPLRVAVGGVGTRPIVLITEPGDLSDAVEHAAATAVPVGGPADPPAYRQAMAPVVARRALHALEKMR